MGRIPVLTTFRTGDEVQDRNFDHIKQTLNPVLRNPLFASQDFRWMEIAPSTASGLPTFALQYRTPATANAVATWTTILTATSAGQVVQPAWIAPTLINGWATPGIVGGLSIGYFKDAMGFVHLRGSGVNAGGVADNVSAFVLPSGYRPSGLARFDSIGEGLPAADAFVDVNTDGNVRFRGAVAAGGVRTMDGITFDTR